VLEQHWYENASEEERAASARVVDHDADELTCPACLATFAKAPRCPECGLNLSG
jgi:predicted amidophosphoribosyltransferase